MGKLKVALISILSIVSLVVLSVFVVQCSSNKAISLEEDLLTAKNNISLQERRRADLIPNLVECVKKFEEHESSTFKELAELRTTDINTEEASSVFNAIAESYPELKADKEYDNLMKELTSTENRISQYREAYNEKVNGYFRYVKRFPNRNFLDLVGHEVKNYKRIEYGDKYEDSPTNIFG